ncbi:hypothetical protein EB796_018303 [Bugula neritina]|uniref:Uncharacterized protein n=1 Tax=Bugula neritina TaxID=10212 RepID=A0A7J7JCM2_BUGNE|nr:hypothetical protein EB796_018303 [Bugula neritina]
MTRVNKHQLTSVHADVPLQVKLFIKLFVTLLALEQPLFGLVHLVVNFTNVTDHSASRLERQATSDAVMQASLENKIQQELK